MQATGSTAPTCSNGATRRRCARRSACRRRTRGSGGSGRFANGCMRCAPDASGRSPTTRCWPTGTAWRCAPSPRPVACSAATTWCSSARTGALSARHDGRRRASCATPGAMARCVARAILPTMRRSGSDCWNCTPRAPSSNGCRPRIDSAARWSSRFHVADEGFLRRRTGTLPLRRARSVRRRDAVGTAAACELLLRLAGIYERLTGPTSRGRPSTATPRCSAQAPSAAPALLLAHLLSERGAELALPVNEGGDVFAAVRAEFAPLATLVIGPPDTAPLLSGRRRARPTFASMAAASFQHAQSRNCATQLAAL